MTIRGTLLSFLLLLASTAFVQSDAKSGQSYAELVNANTLFAFKLFRATAVEAHGNNVLVAPVSLSLDFALLQNFAEKDAREEIFSAFEFGEASSQEINSRSQALRKNLIYDPPSLPVRRRNRQGIQPPPICCAPAPEHLTLAGSLWAGPHAVFSPRFLHLSRDLYSFETRSVATKGDAATKAVNTWVARQTGELLTDALDSWGKDDFILVDTTSFKGAWQKPFYEQDTKPGDFSLPSGQKKQIPLMDQWGYYSYFRGTKFQAVRLPYGRAAMYVFLPDSDSDLRKFEQVLTAENWSSWLSQMAEREGHLKLPRFSLQYRAEISQVLVDLGMPQVFYPVFSFSPLVLNPEGAALTRVLQAVLIKVDEKGTEAAAATFVGGVIGGISSGPKPEPFQMIVDHPFFFAICDNETQTILYMGAINDPIPLSSAR